MGEIRRQQACDGNFVGSRRGQAVPLSYLFESGVSFFFKRLALVHK